MLNQVILVGRVSKDVEVSLLDDGRKKAVLSLDIKNKFNEYVYESYSIPVVLWDEKAEDFIEYCSVGSTVGVKASLRVVDLNIEVIAEKITFINIKEDNKN